MKKIEDLTPAEKCLRYCDEILTLVERGMTLVDACKLKPEYPKFQTLYARIQRDPAKKARLSAAIASRPSFRTKRKYEDSDYTEVLKIIAAHPSWTIKRIFAQAMPEHLPRILWINLYCGVDSEFAKRYEDLLKARAAGVVKKWYNVATHGRQRRIVVNRPGGQLLGLLHQHDLWLKASKPFKGMIGQDADDLAMDAVVALLEARPLSRKQIRLDHYKRTSSHRTKSIDVKVYSDGSRTERVDLLTTCTEVMRW